MVEELIKRILKLGGYRVRFEPGVFEEDLAIREEYCGLVEKDGLFYGHRISVGSSNFKQLKDNYVDVVLKDNPFSRFFSWEEKHLTEVKNYPTPPSDIWPPLEATAENVKKYSSYIHKRAEHKCLDYPGRPYNDLVDNRIDLSENDLGLLFNLFQPLTWNIENIKTKPIIVKVGFFLRKKPYIADFEIADGETPVEEEKPVYSNDILNVEQNEPLYVSEFGAFLPATVSERWVVRGAQSGRMLLFELYTPASINEEIKTIGDIQYITARYMIL